MGSPPKSPESIQTLVRDLASTSLEISQTRVAEAQAHARVQRVTDGGTLEELGSTAEILLTEYRSSLPPPAILKEYDLQQPGLRQIMVAEWQADQAHRRDIEKGRLSNDRQRLWLRAIATVVGVLVLGAVAILATPAATGIVASSGAAGVGLFAWVKRKRQGGTQP